MFNFGLPNFLLLIFVYGNMLCLNVLGFSLKTVLAEIKKSCFHFLLRDTGKKSINKTSNTAVDEDGKVYLAVFASYLMQYLIFYLKLKK